MKILARNTTIGKKYKSPRMGWGVLIKEKGAYGVTVITTINKEDKEIIIDPNTELEEEVDLKESEEEGEKEEPIVINNTKKLKIGKSRRPLSPEEVKVLQEEVAYAKEEILYPTSTGEVFNSNSIGEAFNSAVSSTILQPYEPKKISITATITKEGAKVICDDTNNTKEDAENRIINATIVLPVEIKKEEIGVRGEPNDIVILDDAANTKEIEMTVADVGPVVAIQELNTMMVIGVTPFKEKVIKETKEGDNMAQSMNKRSVTIDEELLKVKKGTVPVWASVADAVIKVGKGTEDDRQKIINETKVRWYRKKKPAATKKAPKKNKGAKVKEEEVPITNAVDNKEETLTPGV